ncbi:hypothetical protein ADIARSV_2163 [Arcticibacter svalbardensis MN12-7]|uniref:Uncharacterized protein n=1 Tax=Arcticibacter svalbardensis MN12-7 TaxID=1150600 RepID=R9GSN8_9SPHI|nr:hypothetical protein [Arcticibacter svalbardensis]EOR94565.1 hypothetical protein ADIARSV_2163 [Arcticibacter svalbardensis MN12-7]
MNNNIITGLKIARKIYMKLFQSRATLYGSQVNMLQNDDANALIIDKLNSPDPIMIARFGAVELSLIANYTSMNNGKKNQHIDFIKGNSEAFWWEKNTMALMAETAGFFPIEPPMLEKFALLMLNDMKLVDVLGSWLWQEKLFKPELAGATRVPLADLEPYYHEHPWSLALKDKKVLVIHPFAKSITEQYKKKDLLFNGAKVLPDFELITLQAIQSVANTQTRFANWFEALNYMKDQIDTIDFDVAIIGCGAYGFPLAAHVKRLGKKAVHLGGATQNLFGIKGKRWETQKAHSRIAGMMNEHWIRPQQVETPEKSQSVEGGAYW